MVDTHLRGKEIDTSDIKSLIIGGQTGVDGIKFCLASTVNGEDLTDPSFNWFLQFKNKYGAGESVSLNPVYEEDLIKLQWIPGITATQVSGKLQIQIYATKVEGEETLKRWVSAPATIYIEEKLIPNEIIPVEPTILEQYLTFFTSLKNEASAFTDKSALWAEEEANVEVDPGKYSAKHHALKAAQTYSNFDARYLGEKASDPSIDNEGNALIAGAIYFNTVTSSLKFYSGSLWVDAMNGAGDITFNNSTSALESNNVQEAIVEITEKSISQPFQTIDYSTNGFTDGRACETEHELYLAGKYLLESVYGSLDPDNSAKALTVFITISSVKYAGLITHEWNSGSPRLKFVYSGGTVYYEKDDATALDTSIRVYNGALRNLSGEKDLRYDLPLSLVAMYSAGDQRNSLRYPVVLDGITSVDKEVLKEDGNTAFIVGSNITDFVYTSNYRSLTFTGAGALSSTGNNWIGLPINRIGHIIKVSGWLSTASGSGVFEVGLKYVRTFMAVATTTPTYFEAYVPVSLFSAPNVVFGAYEGVPIVLTGVQFQEVLSGDITGTAYVAEAHDIVGTNDASQSTEALQPIKNGKGFDTSGNAGCGLGFASLPFTSLQTPWWFAVKVKWNSLSSTGGYTQTILMLYKTYTFRMRIESDGKVTIQTDFAVPTIFNSNLTTGTPYRLILIFDGISFRFFVNGLEIIDTTATTGSGAYTNRLFSYSTSNGAINGISHLPMFGEGSLTPTEIAQLDAILEAE